MYTMYITYFRSRQFLIKILVIDYLTKCMFAQNTEGTKTHFCEEVSLFVFTYGLYRSVSLQEDSGWNIRNSFFKKWLFMAHNKEECRAYKA